MVSLTAVRVTIAFLVLSILWAVAGTLAVDSEERLLVRLSGLALFSVAFDTSWAHEVLRRGSRVAAQR